jgi:hypothetical protein
MPDSLCSVECRPGYKYDWIINDSTTKKRRFMTRIGEFLTQRNISMAVLSRLTGIGVSRLTRLSYNQNASATANELYLIASAIRTDLHDLLAFVCHGARSENNSEKGNAKKTLPKKRKSRTAVFTFMILMPVKIIGRLKISSFR